MGSFFLFIFYFFSFQQLEKTSDEGEKEGCRGTLFPWESCRTYVQEIECRNYCM